MAKIKAIELTEDERTALEKGWKHGPSHAFCQRCQLILLKSQWLISQEVARQVGCGEVVVNPWRRWAKAWRSNSSCSEPPRRQDKWFNLI